MSTQTLAVHRRAINSQSILSTVRAQTESHMPTRFMSFYFEIAMRIQQSGRFDLHRKSKFTPSFAARSIRLELYRLGFNGIVPGNAQAKERRNTRLLRQTERELMPLGRGTVEKVKIMRNARLRKTVGSLLLLDSHAMSIAEANQHTFTNLTHNDENSSEMGNGLRS